MNYPKRLIEVDLPIKKISAHARREKSIRHGHISTLHIWWARRPLASCRAVLCAALWPDPADPNCPQKFRDDGCRLINEFATKAASSKSLAQYCSQEAWKKWQALARNGGGLDPSKEAHRNVLRFVLLDFIADFANWDNSTATEYLETARALTQSAHESLGGAPGTRPLVVDPFAGGGAIPLESLRIGADSFASDLNPVAVLLNKAVLEYIPRHGYRLAEEVRKWGKWIKDEAHRELVGRYYPPRPDGSTPIAYLWARTIRCEGPACGAVVPLIRSPWLAKKRGRSFAAAIAPEPGTKNLRVRILKNPAASEVGAGSVRRGSATCYVCGYTTHADAVKRQLKEKRGGADDPFLFAVITATDGERGRGYHAPEEIDYEAAAAAREHAGKLLEETLPGSGVPLLPRESTLGYHSFVNRGAIYGMNDWSAYFTSRQLLSLGTLLRHVRAVASLAARDCEHDLAEAVQTMLALALDRQVDFTSSLASWWSGGEKVQHTFARQALPMVWDFAEVNPWSDSTGCWSGAYEWGAKVVEHVASSVSHAGRAEQVSAHAHVLPDDIAGALVTDPPYYYSVQYADLSDFLYVWLRRALDRQDLLFRESVPKEDEIIVQSPGHEYATDGKNNAFYEARMMQAMREARRYVSPSGIGVVVFAHTSTRGWEALLQAMVDAGWIVTGSWPIDTEMATRVLALDRSVLASSVHLVCRPRERSAAGEVDADVGEWRDVLSRLPKRIHEWMPRLQAEGVVGADAIFACLGPALEIFSCHARVEKPNGDQVTLKEYLEYVWAAVSREALSMIFAGADTTGFEEDARLTAIWLWTLSSGLSDEAAANAEQPNEAEDADGKLAQSGKSSGFMLEYDAARKIAQGLGAHLELMSGLVEVKGETARLLPVAERTKSLFGKEGTEAPSAKQKKSAQLSLPGLLEELEQEDSGWTLQNAAKPGDTSLDRLHQAMILFAAGRGEALRRFLVDDGVGKDQKFWRLAQSLCALYPSGTDERRWSEGVLARKKSLGL